MIDRHIWGRGRCCAWATVEGRKRTDLGSVRATMLDYYQSITVEAGGGAKAKISPGKAGMWFRCCFTVTGGGRVEGNLREKMDDGQGKGRLELFSF